MSFCKYVISPYLIYRIFVWGQGAKVHINKFLVRQKRALRKMFFAEPTDHAIPFFQQTRSIPFKFLYFNRLLLLMVEVYHQDVPSDLRSTFKLTTDVHNYRGHLLIFSEYVLDMVFPG